MINRLVRRTLSDTRRSNTRSSDYYAFWNMDFGERAITRPLPYKGMEDDAMHPFVEKLEHVLSINGEDKKIPCLKMYGEECSICKLSAKYYKEEGKKSEKGKYYWRDKKSLASIYVVEDPLPADDTTGEKATGTVKVAQFGNQLAERYTTKFSSLLEDDEIEDFPWSLTNGLNFKIIKEQKGEYAKYDSSDFMSKPTSLPKDFIANFEPVDLHSYLPVNPGAEKVQRMLDAHLSGEDYADDDSDNHKPATEEKVTKKVDKKTEVTDEPAVTKKVTKEATVVKEAVKEADAEVETTSAAKAAEVDAEDDDDFLAKLKRRSKANAA
jgi:hypothetical protein